MADADYEYRRIERNLSSGRSDPVHLASDVCELTVEQVDAEAYLHIGGQGAQPIRAFPGMNLRLAAALEGNMGDVYLSNPAGSGIIRVQTRNGLCVTYGGGGAGVVFGGPDSFSPLRLEDALAAGNALNSGDRITEDIGIEGADVARVRARASGMEAFSQVATEGSTANPRNFAYDPANDRFFVATNAFGSEAGKVREYSISGGPTSPTVADTVDLTIDSIQQIAYDPTAELVYVVGYDGSDTRFYTVDASTVGTLGTTANTAALVSGLGGASAKRIAIDEADQLAFVQVSKSGGKEDLIAIDTSSPAETDRTTLEDQATEPYFWESRNELYVVDREGVGDKTQVHIYNVDSSGSITLAAEHNVQNVSDLADSLLVAETEERLFWYDGGADELRMYDVSDPVNISLVDTYSHGAVDDFSKLYIDREGSEPVVWAQDGGNLRFHLLTFAGDVLEQSVQYNIDGTTDDRQVFFDYFPELYLYVGNISNNEIRVYSIDRGAVELEAVFLDPTGAVVKTKTGSLTAMESGVEGVVDVDPKGEAELRVALENKGDQDGSVDYVDVYREAV